MQRPTTPSRKPADAEEIVFAEIVPASQSPIFLDESEPAEPVFLDQSEPAEPVFLEEVAPAKPVPPAAAVAVPVEDEEIISIFAEEDSFGSVPAFPHLLKHPLRAIRWLAGVTYGIVSLIFFLSVLAAIPIVNCLTLGYLLEVEGRLGRTGRLRYAFPLIDLASRAATVVIGFTAFLFPLSLLAGYVTDAGIIDPGGPSALQLARVLGVMRVLVLLHLGLAVGRGATFWSFFNPSLNLIWLYRQLRAKDGSGFFPARSKREPIAPCPMCGQPVSRQADFCGHCGDMLPDEFHHEVECYWDRTERKVLNYLHDLRLGHHFSLGLRGALGAFLWLLIPTALFAAAKGTEDGTILLTLLGALLLMPTLPLVMILQTRFAAENRLVAFLEIRAAFRSFRQAPFAWLLAMLSTLLLAWPYYLFKIKFFDPGAMWLATGVFVTTIYLSRVLRGWANGRANRKERKTWFGWCCLSALLVAPALFVFVFFLFFTQGIGEYGKATLFDHHAFLMPLLMG